MDQYHDLERQLSHALTTPSHAANDGHSDSTEAPGDTFVLQEFLDGAIIERRATDGGAAKRLGVCFRNLTVKGVQSSTQTVKTLPRAILNTFFSDPYRVLTKLIPPLRLHREPMFDIIKDFSGTVRDGEMMLVLGRPGSGCSTFLKAIANQHQEFAQIDGEVFYGGMSSDHLGRYFRGEAAYCEEDDRHLPTLNVSQTLLFALLNKTRRKNQWTIPIVLGHLLQMFGIEHTNKTQVGDEHLRGISGGERKRVSLAEALCTKASVICWDNSTRGLDSSTALNFAKAMRVYTDVSRKTTLMTLYQAGESIFELMDKVMVIDEGRVLFQGPAQEAKGYFHDLGFQCPPRQTTADFLTSVADPNARHFQPGREASTPKTPTELEQAFRSSVYFQKIQEDIDNFNLEAKCIDCERHRKFEAAVNDDKSKATMNRSAYTVSFVRQVAACVRREFWLLLGDKASLYTKICVAVANSLIVGSLFYGVPDDTSAVFARGSTAFFSVVFLGWLQMSELGPAMSGSAIINRHRAFALYRPSAVVIARFVLDFPILLVIVSLFSLPMYFLSGLDVDVSKFWIYILMVYTCTFSLTTMFRMFASLSPTLDDAVRFSGLGVNLLIIYSGYVIPITNIMTDSPWFGWLVYVSPVMFTHEAVMANEFTGRDLECNENQLVPRGPGAVRGYQGCTLPGSRLGSTNVNGDTYIETALAYSHSHLWRNFGVVLALTAGYLAVTIFSVERLPVHRSGSQGRIYASKAVASNTQSRQRYESAVGRIGDGNKVFTFKNVEFTVPYGTGQRKLLNRVSGFAKPGKMVALIGSSGAGKTTLLNTLAQRQITGVVSGEMLVNGKPLENRFQRDTGFCEQRDIHDGASTIREAFEFSALLRQDREIPRHEKLAYVDQILELLEMKDSQYALISSLNVEERKRVTIGVELAAKPSLLLFLDEPTSGLDSQSAYTLVRFLRKLCDAGQAIICTIHQPSSDLIEQFDMILALNSGGNTFYFGPVGQNGSVVIDYFARRGTHCAPNLNVAEFILETAAQTVTKNGQKVSWEDEWRTSEELAAILAEIDQIGAEELDDVPLKRRETEYAAPTLLQTHLLMRRIFIQYWREPSYAYSRLWVNTLYAIFVGFTFWMLDETVAGMQNRMFVVGLGLIVPTIVVNSVVPKFFRHRDLWEQRELPSRTYGWVAFCTATLMCEIPLAIISGTLYFLLSYFAVGFPTGSSVSGYVYFMFILFSVFQASWGQWIAAFAPTYSVVANLLPFFFIMANLFNGIFLPYRTIPDFWKYWIYYLLPTTWYSRGVLSAVLPGTPVHCSASEFARFNPPEGMSCGEYAGEFVDLVAHSGYLEDPESVSNCGYCPYKDGREYMATLNVHLEDKWRGLGIMFAYIIANWLLVYFFIYTVRVRRWTFGLGTVFGGMRVIWDKIMPEKTYRKQGEDSRV
ncbi:related to pleiotropic drug resistance proteins (PDR1-15), ABC superfamily [Fusarium fujikuroi]|nr:related to pleiotropic drug resistance proteins (PDR1-15), ABC superfamily [Fusarium fujikuroi]